MEYPNSENSTIGNKDPGIAGSTKKSPRQRRKTAAKSNTPGIIENPIPPTTQDVETAPVLEPTEINVETVQFDQLIPGAVKSTGTDPKNISATAIVLMTVIDGLVISAFGDQAKMSSVERSMIQAPLERILAKMDIANNVILQKYLDPLMLAMGLMVWGLRISKINQTPIKQNLKTQEKAPAPPEPTQPAAPPPNGHIPGGIDGSQLSAPPNISQLFRGESIG